MKFKRQEMPDGTVQMVRDTEADYSHVGRGEAPESAIDLLPDPQAQGLFAVAEAINRLADVYLYVNDPEGEGGPAPTSMPDGFRGMR